MTNIHSINFRPPDWLQPDGDAHASTHGSQVWTNSAGDRIYLKYFDIPPDIPAPLSRLNLVWQQARISAFWNQAAPISIECTRIGVLDALSLITKHVRGMETSYQGTLIIPRRDFSFTFIVQSESRETISEREQHVIGEGHGGTLPLREADPFGFNFISPIMRSWSDDGSWDERFPRHPLSRIRACLKAITTGVTFDESVLQAAPFVGTLPVAAGGSEEFAQIFSVTDAEQQMLDEFGISVAETIENLIAGSPYDTSTTALMAEAPVYGLSDHAEFLRQFDNRPPRPSRAFADWLRARLGNRRPFERTCLILYASRTDETFAMSTEMMSRFYATRDKERRHLRNSDVLFSKNNAHWEFVISRLMKTVGVRSLILRPRLEPRPYTGVATVREAQRDWFARLIVLVELVDVVVFATMMSEGMAKEIGHVFGDKATRAKVLYMSSDNCFHLADEPEAAWPVQRLPEVATYIMLRASGMDVHIDP